MLKKLKKWIMHRRHKMRREYWKAKCACCSETTYAFCKGHPRSCYGPYDW